MHDRLVAVELRLVDLAVREHRADRLGQLLVQLRDRLPARLRMDVVADRIVGEHLQELPLRARVSWSQTFL